MHKLKIKRSKPATQGSKSPTSNLTNCGQKRKNNKAVEQFLPELIILCIEYLKKGILNKKIIKMLLVSS